MRDLLKKFLDRDISRRELTMGLTALGLSSAAVNSVVADAIESEDVFPRDGVMIEGTGAEVLLQTLISADVKYLFGTTGTGMSALFDAMTLKPDVQQPVQPLINVQILA